jgi:hypothetical protein
MLRELFFESASKPYYLRRENLMSPEKQNPILSKNLADLGLKKNRFSRIKPSSWVLLIIWLQNRWKMQEMR